MFDLIQNKVTHIPGGGGSAVLATSALHVGVLTALIVGPLLFVTNALPDVPTMMAFVAEVPAPPPPPPPPPPPAPATEARPVATANPDAAPIEAPSSVEPEKPGNFARVDEGVPGGVEGGIPGVVGGIVGGIPDEPPPPPPPPARRAPVRIGGNISQPALLHRVNPTYPEIAIQAHVQGTVILEAVVDEDGRVQNLRVLRSIPLLDKAAIAAVEQWRYSPVILNGKPVPFVLTVVLTFSFPDKPEGRY
jgi:protein TonB